MIWEGNVRKMSSVLDTEGLVLYNFEGADVVQRMSPQATKSWLGRHVDIQFEGVIHCVSSGKKIRKTYGEGLSYDAFIHSPLACPSIIRPELSRIHEGIALRDEKWERENHLQPHVVYVSQTSHFKVGVTRTSNVPSRWMDQGAVGAVVIARAPYRQLAGEMEVALKESQSDRTNWRAMLQDVKLDSDALIEVKEQCLEVLGLPYESFFEDSDDVARMEYPVLEYPEKLKSVKLERQSHINGRLIGIKGQYWMFDDGRVWNVRSHAGYRIRLEVS